MSVKKDRYIVDYVVDIVLAAIFMALYVVVQVMTLADSVVILSLGYALFVAVSVAGFITVRKKHARFPMSFEQRTPVSLWRAIKIIVGTFVLMYVGQIVIGIIQVFGFGLENTTENQEQLNAMLSTPGLFALTVVLIVLVAPVLEELIFRYFLIGRIPARANGFFMFRVVFSVVIFALIHVSFDVESVTALVFAIIVYMWVSSMLTFIYIRTGSIWYSILGHMFNNSIAVAQMIFLTM